MELVLPMQLDARGCELTEDTMKTLLEATQYKVPLQELQVVYEESGEFDQTALALEHLRWDCMWSLCDLFKDEHVDCLFNDTVYHCLDFFINIFGGSGMKKMKTMILTTLCALWSHVSDCEYSRCVNN